MSELQTFGALAEELSSVVSQPRGARSILDAVRLAQVVRQEHEAAVAQGAGRGGVLGAYHLGVAAHVALLGGEASDALQLSVAASDLSLYRAKDFWRAYAAWLAACLGGPTDDLPTLAARGRFAHWRDVVALLRGLVEDPAGVPPLVAVARQNLARRNSNKSLEHDLYEIEGSVESPVAWDFRVESLADWAGRSGAA